MNTFRSWLVVLLSPAFASAQPVDPMVKLIRSHCVDCHGAEIQRAGLRLDNLTFDASDLHSLDQWIRIHDRIAAGEMPPAKAEQPTTEHRQSALGLLHKKLHAASQARQEKEGRVPLRRLNRAQHENTLNDLLHIAVNLKDILPDDPSSAGFDNVAEGLNVSSVHLLGYQKAADMALAAAITWRPEQKLTFRRTGRDLLDKQFGVRGLLGKSARLEGERLLFFAQSPGITYMETPSVPATARYRLRFSAQAINTNGQPLAIQFALRENRIPGRIVATRDLPAEKARLIELEVMLREGAMVVVSALTLPSEDKLRATMKGQSLDDYKGPGLAFDFIEIEGPLETFPLPGHRRLFAELPLKAASAYKIELAGKVPPRISDNRTPGEWLRDPLIATSTAPKRDALRLLRDFLPRAFRRPVDEATLATYVKYFDDRIEAGHGFHDAMRSTYKSILSSPRFFYLNENPGKLDDYALAARLSYLLWSSLPDDPLLELAGKKALHDPKVLRAQVERMVDDERSQRFVDNFTGQWLDLRKINATTPDPSLYGEFDGYLHWSMLQETESFFREVLKHDLSIVTFVDSDWTMLNERLARHYGIGKVTGGEIRRVKLAPGSHRGGVMTHASILRITANGTNTSPILRGKWVLEKILGTPPTPPPPDLPAIEPDIRGATTIREQLAKHQNSKACAACHKHIDPPGFALESFDVIGGWREYYRVSNAPKATRVALANYPERLVWRGRDVEVGGTLPDGRTFKDIRDYKMMLLADKEKLARNVVKHLVVFATGADIQYADREEIQAIAARARTKDYGLRTLIHEVVQSRVFQNK